MLDVLLPSAYFCDLVFTGLPGIPKLGDEIFSQRLKVIPGAGFIPAVALTRLGMQVSWACDFGNDFFSRYVLEEADRQNLSTTFAGCRGCVFLCW
jgi:sugar/nucleoside kinase (ribokinase family)